MSTTIKKRTRRNIRRREIEEDNGAESDNVPGGDDEQKLTPEEILALRKLQRGRQGINITKLNKGDSKKRRRKEADAQEEEKGGLSVQSKALMVDDSDEEAKARRVVRSNNFTQQTNALDVDKHMLAYIEENMKKRRGENAQEQRDEGPRDPFEDLYQFNKHISQNITHKHKPDEEGNVTNSLAMLTAIPEVDLGINTRLKNIEETEKAKRQVAEDRRLGKSHSGLLIPKDEEHLAAARFYRPHSTNQLDAEALRRAKLEAMGLSGEEAKRSYNENRVQTATDEQVMERFKKRMRK